MTRRLNQQKGDSIVPVHYDALNRPSEWENIGTSGGVPFARSRLQYDPNNKLTASWRDEHGGKGGSAKGSELTIDTNLTASMGLDASCNWWTNAKSNRRRCCLPRPADSAARSAASAITRTDFSDLWPRV